MALEECQSCESGEEAENLIERESQNIILKSVMLMRMKSSVLLEFFFFSDTCQKKGKKIFDVSSISKFSVKYSSLPNQAICLSRSKQDRIASYGHLLYLTFMN